MDIENSENWPKERILIVHKYLGSSLWWIQVFSSKIPNQFSFIFPTSLLISLFPKTFWSFICCFPKFFIVLNSASTFFCFPAFFLISLSPITFWIFLWIYMFNQKFRLNFLIFSTFNLLWSLKFVLLLFTYSVPWFDCGCIP